MPPWVPLLHPEDGSFLAWPLWFGNKWGWALNRNVLLQTEQKFWLNFVFLSQSWNKPEETFWTKITEQVDSRASLDHWDWMGRQRTNVFFYHKKCHIYEKRISHEFIYFYSRQSKYQRNLKQFYHKRKCSDREHFRNSRHGSLTMGPA